MIKTKNNIAIVLGIICIVLAASLVVVVANGSFSNDQPNTSDLENQVITLNAQVNALQNIVYDYEGQIEDLTDKNNMYNSIIDLEESVVIINSQTYTQDANEVTTLFDDMVYYAGYIEIQVESTSNTTYIQVSYTYDDLEFNQIIPIGQNGTAYFPVLPEIIEILLGNTDTEVNTATITLTYFY
jgi:outer membrane murein-binding lipoprotein Lpp